MKKLILLLTILSPLLIISKSFAQESACKVLKEEINKKYEGDCKNGLAHGKGIAIGKDKYEGKFKKGLPHGMGTYRWASGEVYTGSFKHGQRNGKGKYNFIINGKDSTYTGFWKNDSLTSIIVPPKYKIIKKANVTRHSVQRMADGNRVLFAFYQNGVPNSTVSNLHISSTKGNLTTFGDKQGYENISFPASFRVTYLTQNSMHTVVTQVEFEVLINEPGDWLVTLHN